MPRPLNEPPFYWKEAPEYITDPSWREEIQGYIDDGFKFTSIPVERPSPIVETTGVVGYTRCCGLPILKHKE